jgi:cytochrome c biogenesis protein CcmG/thiol:disulfide interchange protein DsbE
VADARLDARLDARAAEAPLTAKPRPAFLGGSRLPRLYLAVAAILPLVLLAILMVSLVSRSGLLVSARIGAPAPQFAVADLNGNPIRLADLRGRPVIVNFWASWCGPCVEEFPLLQRALEAHRGEGLAIIGIVYADRSEAARAFIGRMGATWPSAMDPDGRLAREYSIFGPPETFFIDRRGTLVSRQIGQLSAADLERQLSAILSKEQ